MAGLSTFADYQAAPASEKIGLAMVQAAQRLTGWALYSGSVYRIAFSYSVIVSIKENGTTLTAVSSVGAVTAGKYYLDRTNAYLYLRTLDSTSPNSKFEACIFKLFFANVPVRAPNDLSTGFDVNWLPLLDETSDFTFECDNTKNFLGVALSSTSGVSLKNDQAYWDPRYDNLTLEGQVTAVYSWNRQLPIAQAKLLYKGRVSRKTYSADMIHLELMDFLSELNAPVSLPLVSEYFNDDKDPIVPESLQNAFQRRIYGYVYSHIPTNLDNVLDTTGYPITGTMTATIGSTAVVGSGTSFLAQLSAGDELLIGDSATRVKVETVTDDTNLVLSKEFPDPTESAKAATVVPSHNKRYANRVHLVCGHHLLRPFATVTAVIDNATFTVDDTTPFMEGDVVEFSGSGSTILVLGDGLIKLVTAFTSTPIVGSTIYRSAIGNVYLDGKVLNLTRDYTYEEDPGSGTTTRTRAATLTLTTTAEFNVAPSKGLTGTLAITSGNRAVVGTGTQFRTELKIGDWISVASGSTWYEILEVIDDTNLYVRTSPGGSESGASLYRKPEVFGPTSVLTCDATGRLNSDDDWLRYPGSIANDILQDAAIAAADIDSTTFTDADEILPHRIGLSIPDKFDAKTAPTIRDVLNLVCRSAFATIIVSKEFVIQMTTLEPTALAIAETYNEEDVIDFTVDSDSSLVVSAANIRYLFKEHDVSRGGEANSLYTAENNQYLAETANQFDLDTCLIDEDDAIIMAYRWAFLLSAVNSNITINTKLKGARHQVFETIELNHEKLYLRIGSTDRERIGTIISLRKTISSVEIIMNDLGNTYSRCARICDDTAADYGSADSDELLTNGYMTDENGLIGDDLINGLNLIW